MTPRSRYVTRIVKRSSPALSSHYILHPQHWGLQLASSREGHVFVLTTADNSPAAKAFLRAGMEVSRVAVGVS